MDRIPKQTSPSLVVLATLGVIAALYLLKSILIPVALALVLACMLSPLTSFLRRILPVGPTGSAVLLFMLTVLCGLYASTLAAESLVQAANTLPTDVEHLSGQASRLLNDLIRDHPSLRGILPEPGTIDLLGDANRTLLIDNLRYGLTDLTFTVAQGFFILILVLFLLAESEMLTPKVIRFFASTPGDALLAERTLSRLTLQIQSYLVARTIINLGLGTVLALALWLLKVKYPFALGLIAAITNFIPYVGQIIGGSLPTLVALGHSGSMGDALIVASIYLAVVSIEGYVVTPFILGRSLDLNGTTVLIFCLFWGFLWGLVGLVLAMPIAVTIKLVFQSVPELNRWAELMSRDWKTPAFSKGNNAPVDDPPPDSPGPLGATANADGTKVNMPHGASPVGSP